MNNLSNKFIKIFCMSMLILVFFTNGCNIQPSPSPTPPDNLPLPTATLAPLQAEITFRVQIPEPLQDNQPVFVDILDEVTGLALNPVRYQMEAIDNRFYTLIIPQIFGSVIKYRYSRGSDASAIEYTAQGNQIRYRLFSLTGPGEVFDLVSAWNDQPYQGPTGRISGTVLDKASNAPIPGLLVEAGGYQTFTLYDGSFLINGLQPGTHNLIIYSMDGAYQTYQQGAVVEADAATPAPVSLNAASPVKVTFIVNAPKEVVGVPIRFCGNLINLGNTFADLSGGVSTLASRLPMIEPQPDGTYALTLDLYAGTDLRYKYTLGDGFWNSEQTEEGNFQVRQLIVPENDTTITDTIQSWISGTTPPIVFDTQAPANTPPTDSVSIQFNPYGWTEPLPMWSMGDNRWYYILYSPLGIMTSLRYRYCRNDQCGSADNAATVGLNPEGWPIDLSNIPQSFQDNISAWNWWQPSSQPTTVSSAEVKPRGPSFMAGVELLSYYNPSWQSRYLPLFQKLKQTGSNWVIINSTWKYNQEDFPILAPSAGNNPFWQDLNETIIQARASGLNIALFALPDFPGTPDEWWDSGKRDFAWWQVWFEQYRRFVLHHAALAEQSGSNALIIGGTWVLPSLPKGKLSGNLPSGVPEDAESRWRQLIKDIRKIYKGSIIWAEGYPAITTLPPSFIDAVDQVYILLSTPVANSSNPTEEELTKEFTRIFDKSILPFAAASKKPILVGVDYPSVDGATSGCLPTADKKCLPFQRLSQPSPDISSIKLDLMEQADIYNALMTTLNQSKGIAGFFSRGFYPPAELQDKSSSVNGKPAFDILWYWFPKLVGGQ